MNFALTEEQAALRDSVARLFTERASFERRRAAVASPEGWDVSAWRALCDLGVGSLPMPESLAGFGGGAVDLMPLMEERGKALSIDPFFTSMVLAGTAIRLAAHDEAQAELLPAIASGERLFAWADDASNARDSEGPSRTVARRSGDDWRLSGATWNVLFAGAADAFVVGATVPGEPGTALFLVEAAAATVRTYVLVDDTPAGEATLDDAPARRLDTPGSIAHADTRRLATALLCAEAVGVMETAFALTVAYLHTRRQFGHEIGEYQALRHRVAEMKIAIEVSRSMAIAAAVAVDDPDSEGADLDVLRAKLVIGRQGRMVCHLAIQLHGGIGMTEEYAVGHCLRRMTVIDQLFGDADSQASRLARRLAA